MKNNDKVDLHLHTTASDGTWSVQELIDKLLDANISLFAITDHDTVENLEVAQAIVNGLDNLTFIPGVEISSQYSQTYCHILGYNIDYKTPALIAFLQRSQAAMNDADLAFLTAIQSQFSQLSLSDYHRYTNDRTRGGWKCLNYLIDTNICTDLNAFFALYDSQTSLPKHPSCFPSAEQAIAIIRQAGGMPVLAHPGAGFYHDDYKQLLNDMRSYGIQGIECYHPHNNPEVTHYCLDFCKQHQLLITGGSDCHGDFIKSRQLGVPDIRFGQLNLSGLIPKTIS